MSDDHRGRASQTEREGWSKAACQKTLKDCAEDLGESPSIPQYKEWCKGVLRPNYMAIIRVFGSWNEAKSNLDLVTYEPEDGHPNYNHVGKHRRDISGWEHTGVDRTDE